MFRQSLVWTNGSGGSQAEEYAEALTDVDEDISRCLLFEHHSPGVPIENLDVVREDNSGNPSVGGQRHFERVSFHVTGNRARDGETGFRIVGPRREDQCRTPTALFVASLRIKGQPHQIADVWYVRASYHTSPPAGAPQSLSSCRFRGVIFATSCARE